jgi:hypothetical protein
MLFGMVVNYIASWDIVLFASFIVLLLQEVEEGDYEQGTY